MGGGEEASEREKRVEGRGDEVREVKGGYEERKRREVKLCNRERRGKDRERKEGRKEGREERRGEERRGKERKGKEREEKRRE